MRILIIDDSKTMRNIVKGVLAKVAPAQTEEAGDGREALAKLDVFQPTLILCDWNMPEMDGLTFVKECRGKGNKTPIIMVTTEAEKAHVIGAIKAGVNNYVVKPFTPESLEKAVRATLEKAKAAA